MLGTRRSDAMDKFNTTKRQTHGKILDITLEEPDYDKRRGFRTAWGKRGRRSRFCSLLIHFIFYSRGSDGGRIVDRYLEDLRRKKLSIILLEHLESVSLFFPFHIFKGVAAFHITR